MPEKIQRTPEYQEYHRKVVDACAALMGEEHRDFFNLACDYLEEFAEGRDPDQVAQDQCEALS